MVYVLNIDGHPIMPTNNHSKVRILLKQKKQKLLKDVHLLFNYYIKLIIIYNQLI